MHASLLRILGVAVAGTGLLTGCGGVMAGASGPDARVGARARVSMDGPGATVAATGLAAALALADAADGAEAGRNASGDVSAEGQGPAMEVDRAAAGSSSGAIDIGAPVIVETTGHPAEGRREAAGRPHGDARSSSTGTPGTASTRVGVAGADTVRASGGAAGGIDARMDLAVGVGIESNGPGAGARAPALGGGPGVRAVGGGRAHLGTLLEMGLNVDGELLTLDQVGALAGAADMDADGSGRIAGDGALDAWVSLEHDQLPRDGGETSLVVRARGGHVAPRARGHLRVHLVLDRSSSMQSSWHEVIAAGRLLVERLEPTDEIQIVAYGTRGQEILALHPVGDGRLALRALERIRVGGGTHIEAGLSLAYRSVASAGERDDDRSLVILVSDGVPTEGSFDAGQLASLAARARVRHGCKTTVIGLGSQFDAEVLLAISREGRGGYHLARTARQLSSTLEVELRAEERIAARDVAIDVRLPQGVELAGSFDANVGLETTDAGVRLSLPKLASGEERTFVVRVRVDGDRRPRKVADVDVAYRVRGAMRQASGESWISFGASARLAGGGGTGIAVLDADLGAALAVASREVRYGNRHEAVGELRAHVARAEARVEHRRSPALARRTRAVAHLATALDSLMPDASYEENRQVGLALGAISVRFGR